MTKPLGVEIFSGDEAQEQFGDPEAMRKADAEAVKRLRQYIDEHRGNMLALEIFTDLWNRYGRD